MEYQRTLDSINKRAYSNKKILRWYDDLDNILRPEEVILESLAPAIKDRKLMDIGIGGGRTTRRLLELSKDYLGIDYSPDFVAVARRKFPEARIECCDARDLGMFATDAFDFALFSFNSIDYIAHDGRIRALAEINRVLKPNGFFMFATHNRDYRGFNKLPWQEQTPFSLGHLKSCLYTFVHLPKHFLMQKHEQHTREYAIVNDTAHGFSLLSYYIGMSEQIRQLERMGFTMVEAYNAEGERVVEDSESPWIHYLARKSATRL